jgi:hypothetical protein
VHPSPRDPYQIYIIYLENTVDNLKWELMEAQLPPDRFSSEDDREPKLVAPSVTPSALVYKTNIGCPDEWCYCPYYEEKKTPPPPSPLSRYYMSSQHSGGSMFSEQYSYR